MTVAASRPKSPLRPLHTDRDWEQAIYRSYASHDYRPPSTPSDLSSTVGEQPWGADSPDSPLMAGEICDWHPFIADAAGDLLPEDAPERQQRLADWVSARSPHETPVQQRLRALASTSARPEQPAVRPVSCWDRQGSYYERPPDMSDVKLPSRPKRKNKKGKHLPRQAPAWMRASNTRTVTNWPTRNVQRFPPIDDVLRAVEPTEVEVAPVRRRRRSVVVRPRTQLLRSDTSPRMSTTGSGRRRLTLSRAARLRSVVVPAPRATKRTHPWEQDSVPFVRRRRETPSAAAGSAETAGQTSTEMLPLSSMTRRTRQRREVSNIPASRGTPSPPAHEVSVGDRQSEEKSTPRRQEAPSTAVGTPTVPDQPAVGTAPAAALLIPLDPSASDEELDFSVDPQYELLDSDEAQ